VETTSDHQETFASPDIDSAITEFAESLVPSEVTPESLMLAAASDDPNEREWAKKELESLLRIKKKKDKYGLNWSTEGMTNRFGKERSLEALETGLPYFTRRADLDVEGAEPNMERPHILIEGDNLHALTVLRGTHTNKVDLIYIDPPYNTGKEFTYNDNFIDPEHPYRHSAWLDFMWRRLKVARELLKETGIVAISIDQNEHHRLVLLCEQVFGESNVVGDISVINNLKGRSDSKFFATAHEFLVVCTKNAALAEVSGLTLTKEERAEYKYRDTLGSYKPVALQKTGKDSLRQDVPNLYYPIYWDEQTGSIATQPVSSNDIAIYPTFADGRDGRWRWGKERVDRLAATELEVRQSATRGPVIYVKMRLESEGEERTKRPKTVWQDPRYDSGAGTREITALFGSNAFTNPKPIAYLSDVISMLGNPNAVVLDFFAGSGTTGHAVAALNAEDGGTRQCIMVTLDENGICQDVTRKRMEAVLTGEWTDGKEHEALPGSLVFYQANGMAELPEFTGCQSDWYMDMNAVAGRNLSECAFISERGWTPLLCSNANLRAAKTAQGKVVAVWLHSFVSIGMLDALKELSDGGVIYVSPKALRNAGGRDILRAAGWETRDYAADFASRINSARETAIQSRSL
jgi:adenine-specific DNA-methyltransferase